MTFKVLLHPNAAKELKKLKEADKLRMKKALETLSADPWKAGKRLHPSDFLSLRAGDYRAIYEIDISQSQVFVLFIGHRKRVYDEFSKLF